jgi:hypothetical protein
MSITLALLFTLAGQCAPDIHPKTIAAIVRTESSGSPTKLHINGGKQPFPAPQTKTASLELERWGNFIDNTERGTKGEGQPRSFGEAQEQDV